MKNSFKLPFFSQNLLIFLIGSFSLLASSSHGSVDVKNSGEKIAISALTNSGVQSPVTIENNSVLAICRDISQVENPIEQIAKKIQSCQPVVEFSGKSENPFKIAKKINVVATAYSSTPWQTDDTPFITADGATVRDGIIANNLLAFGTRVRIPELYGSKIFTVEDRMHWRKGNYHIDIWFPSYQQAVNFGAKTTYIEVLN